MLKRLELPDGQWADLLVKPRHAEYLAITEAIEDALRGRGSVVAVNLVRAQQFTKAWSVRGEDGRPVPLDDWSEADPDITDAISTEASNRWSEWDEQRRPLVTPRQRKPRPESPSPETSEPSSDDTSEATPSG